jgi:hypothetical protein
MMKLSIYNTDEENLLLVPKPTDEWVSCEIFRCSDDVIKAPPSTSPAQYEVWKTSYNPHDEEKHTKFIGSYDFLREAFEKAHQVAAESKDIKDLSDSLKNLEDTLLEEEEALEALEKELTKESDNEIGEFSSTLLMNKIISRSIN